MTKTSTDYKKKNQKKKPEKEIRIINSIACRDYVQGKGGDRYGEIQGLTLNIFTRH